MILEYGWGSFMLQPFLWGNAIFKICYLFLSAIWRNKAFSTLHTKSSQTDRKSICRDHNFTSGRGVIMNSTCLSRFSDIILQGKCCFTILKHKDSFGKESFKRNKTCFTFDRTLYIIFLTVFTSSTEVRLTIW